MLLKFFDLIERRLNPFKPRADYHPPAGFMAFCWHYVSQLQWFFAAMAIFAVFQGALPTLEFWLMGQMIDQMTAGIYPNETLSLLITVFLVHLLIFVCNSIVQEQFIVNDFFQRTRWQIHQHLTRLGIRYFDDELSGSLATKSWRVSESIGDTLTSALDVVLFAFIFILSTAGILFSIDWRLTLVVVIWIGLFAAAARHFIPKIRQHSKSTSQTSALVQGRMVDSYGNMPIIKLYAPNDPFVEDGLQQHFKRLLPFTRTITLMRSTHFSLGILATLVLVGLTLHLWQNELATAGEVAVVFSLSVRIVQLTGRLMGNLNYIYRQVGVIDNAIDTLHATPDIKDPDAPATVPEFCQLQLDNASFNYSAKAAALHNINLTIKRGEKIGIVGPSGGGKSTLLKLILRFYDVNGGQVRYNDHDIRRFAQNTYRQQFDLVQQEAVLFHRSLRDNITMGGDYNDDEIWAAIKKANATSFIEGLVDSKHNKALDAVVGERGVKLSGGQRQRIHLARVFLRNAPILLLDEATSQLDSESEAVIRENIDALTLDKTVISVAHRLSTIRRMDRIVLLNEGKVEAVAPHKELLESNVLYKRLWELQAR
ncbi:MAG: ABC transporter ATP-binding protein [Gammaproteobacteria bacterium]|nr:ABC transporter ATP-binding protein [Gammaproteobacteria bacterium]